MGCNIENSLDFSVDRCISSLVHSLFCKTLHEKIVYNSYDNFIEAYSASSRKTDSGKVNDALEKTVEYLLKESHKMKIDNYSEIDWDFHSGDEWWIFNWNK